MTLTTRNPLFRIAGLARSEMLVRTVRQGLDYDDGARKPDKCETGGAQERTQGRSADCFHDHLQMMLVRRGGRRLALSRRCPDIAVELAGHAAGREFATAGICIPLTCVSSDRAPARKRDGTSTCLAIATRPDV